MRFPLLRLVWAFLALVAMLSLGWSILSWLVEAP